MFGNRRDTTRNETCIPAEVAIERQQPVDLVRSVERGFEHLEGKVGPAGEADQYHDVGILGANQFCQHFALQRDLIAKTQSVAAPGIGLKPIQCRSNTPERYLEERRLELALVESQTVVKYHHHIGCDLIVQVMLSIADNSGIQRLPIQFPTHLGRELERSVHDLPHLDSGNAHRSSRRDGTLQPI